MAAVMEESFETCIDIVSDLKAKLSKNPEFAEKMANKRMQAGCSPLSAVLMTCVNMETFKNCPASAWKDSAECNAALNYMKQCKFHKGDD